MNDASLDGAVALVTGAGSGVGAATAKRLARHGAAVSLVARSAERLDLVAQEIARMGGHAVPVVGDITDRDRAYGAVQDTLDRFGRLDIVVNNAEVRLLSSALHTSLDEWDRMVALNVTALLHVTHAAVPYLIDAATTSPRQVADLVNIGSTAGPDARPGSSVYSLTKLGLRAFTESLRRELVDECVRVCLVEPGTVDTEPAGRLGQGSGDVLSERIARDEALPPQDLADAIAYAVTRDRQIAVNQIVLRAGHESC